MEELWDKFVHNCGWYEGYGKKRKFVVPINFMGSTDEYKRIFLETIEGKETESAD